MNENIIILGNGAWGTALAHLLGNRGEKVQLFGRNKDSIEEINTKHTNSAYLPNISLPKGISGISEREKIQGGSLLILAIPMSEVRGLCQEIHIQGGNGIPLLSSTKGIEKETGKCVSQIAKEILPQSPFSVLSGPNHAEEVSQAIPSCSIIASQNSEMLKKLQALFQTPFFHILPSQDVKGVELAGSLKNIYAIMGGMLDGFSFGDNSKAALLSKSLEEMLIIGRRLGGRPETFQGISGLGDLVVTFFSQYSRNFQFGSLLAKGFPVEKAKEKVQATIEGIYTTKIVKHLTEKEKLFAPILNEIYSILYEKIAPEKERLSFLLKLSALEEK